MRGIARCIVALLLTAPLMPAPAAELSPGISGAWYNPAQSGHGLGIEVLDGDRVLLFWNVFDPAGDPLNLYVEGVLEGQAIVGDAYATRGMRFGSFDPSSLDLRRWGTLRIDFDSCDSGTLHYQADGEAGGAAFGSGSLPLVRLTSIADLPCRFLGKQALPTGLYSGERPLDSLPPVTRPVRVAVAPDDTLWGIEQLVSDSTEMPAGTYMENRGPTPAVLIGTPVDVGTWAVTFDLQAFRNTWQEVGGPSDARRAGKPLQLSIDPQGDIEAGLALDDGAPLPSVRIHRPHDSARDLEFPLSLELLAGTYRLHLIGEFFGSHDQLVTVAEDGALCVASPFDPGDCRFNGVLTIPFPGHAFVDFTLQHATEDSVFTGRGWLDLHAQGGVQLVLVGRSGDEGLGLIGIRQ